MALRDLLIRLRMEEEGVTTAIEQANEELNTIADAAEEAQAQLEELGAVGEEAGEQVAAGLTDAGVATEALAAQAANAGPALGAIGMALLGFSGMAAKAATDLEWNVTRLQVLAREDFPEIARAIEEEVQRTKRALTFGQLADLLAPIAATLPGNAEIITQAIRQVDDAIIMMGGDAQAAERAWLYIAQAIGSGSAEILTRASRFMPFPLIRGDEARQIARQMKPEYDAVTNAMILMEAIARSTRIEMEEMNRVMDTTRFKLIQLHGAWGDFLEAYGRGAAEAKGAGAAILRDILDWAERSGLAEALGSYGTLLGGFLSVVFGRALMNKLLGWLGVGGGSLSAALVRLFPWAIFLLGVEDLLHGSDSAIVQFMQGLLESREKLWQVTNDWGEAVKVTADNWKWAVSQMWKDWQMQRDLATQETRREQALAGAYGEEVKWEQEMADLARSLFEATNVQVITTQETMAQGWPAMAAEVFGDQWMELALELREGRITAEDLIRVMEHRERIDLAIPPIEPGFTVAIPPTVPERPSSALPQTIDLDASLTQVDRLFPAPEITITFGPGAVTVSPEANLWQLPEEERDKIIEETLQALEAQLRAALDERTRPGVR